MFLFIIGNITGLIPHTEYMISMIACTSGGCAESPDTEGLIINTHEEGTCMNVLNDVKVINGIS